MATGDLDRAWADLEVAFAHWDRYHAAHHYPLLWIAAVTARSLDRRDAGTRLRGVREAYAHAEAIRARELWAPVIDAELDDSLEAWRVAWVAAVEPGAPSYLRPYAGLRLAQHLVPARERAEARAVLTAAAAEAGRLGARLMVSQLAALAARAGFASVADPATTGVEATPNGVLTALTARETEVLRLVADGRSNGEIGAALFISTKTASVHVSNILAKLEVASRGEAAAMAHREGLLSDVGDGVVSLRPA